MQTESVSRIVSIDEFACDNCGSRDFLIGAAGGAAVNIHCSNCGKYYNVVFLSDSKIWIVNE